MIAAYIEQLKASLHDTVIGQYAWLESFIGSLIGLLTGPFTGIRTRYYWPEIVGAIVFAAFIFVARDRRPGQNVGGFLRYLFPRAVFIHPSTWMDIKLLVANHFVVPAINLTWRLGAPLFIGVLLALMTAIFGPAPRNLEWTTTTIFLYALLHFLADDFGYYVYHYLMHRVPWLWAFHKVHHSAETLQVFANVRSHPVEHLLGVPFGGVMTALVMAPALYFGVGEAPYATLLGFSLLTVIAVAIGGQLHHSHIWISWAPPLAHVFVSPAMHQIHHSTAERHWNKNMGGNIALWDWIFGTIYVPRHREQLTFGVGGGAPQPHPTLLAAYLVPFLEIMPFRERLIAWMRPIVRRLPAESGSAPRGSEQASNRPSPQ